MWFYRTFMLLCHDRNTSLNTSTKHLLYSDDSTHDQVSAHSVTCERNNRRAVIMIMEISILAGRQREQNHQANRLFTLGFYPRHSYAKHDISCPFAAAADSVCSSWALGRRNQEAPSHSCPGVPTWLPASLTNDFKVFTVYKALCCLAARTVSLCCGPTTALTRCPCSLIHVPDSSLDFFQEELIATAKKITVETHNAITAVNVIKNVIKTNNVIACP